MSLGPRPEDFADQLRTHPVGAQQFQLSGGYRTDDGVDERIGLTVRASGPER
jgi:hypothetical protein